MKLKYSNIHVSVYIANYIRKLKSSKCVSKIINKHEAQSKSALQIPPHCMKTKISLKQSFAN